MNRRTVLLVAGPTIVALYAAVAVLTITVWNPIAAVPHLSHAEIVAALAEEGVDVRATAVSTGLWGGVGIVLSAAVSALALTRVLKPWTIIAWQLVIVAAGIPAYWVASFSMGMDVADTFHVGGADHTRWSAVLYLVSGIACVALVAGELSPRLRRAIDGRFSQRTR
jgi:hypothetical protein